MDSTVHMWEDAEGGLNHIVAGVANTRCSEPPAFVLEDPSAAPAPEDGAAHSEYEASRWPVFLPALYHLWEGHPDPSQYVPCDLTVENTENGLRVSLRKRPCCLLIFRRPFPQQRKGALALSLHGRYLRYIRFPGIHSSKQSTNRHCSSASLLVIILTC